MTASQRELAVPAPPPPYNSTTQTELIQPQIKEHELQAAGEGEAQTGGGRTPEKWEKVGADASAGSLVVGGGSFAVAPVSLCQSM